MRALVLEEFGGPLVHKDIPDPTIDSHEVLVRVCNVGVCGTDLKIRAGRMGLNVIPLVMGHEIAGEVAEVGAGVRGVAPGRPGGRELLRHLWSLPVLPGRP